MKENKFSAIMRATIIFIIFLLFIRSMVVYEKDTVWRNDNFCELRYNTQDRGYDNVFGKYCVIANFTDYSKTKFYYNNSVMYDFCKTNIKFFELNRWKDKCSLGIQK